jgi:hypothetical protein
MDAPSNSPLSNTRKALESLKELAESPTQNWAFCFLGVGRAYCKLNLFAEAVPWLDRGLAAVEKEVLNTGVTHLWPGTTVVIEETKSDHLKKNLQELLKKCKIPLLPEARCRFEDCKEPQREIYFSNIPYNGCVILKCEKNCGFAYHRTCWNKIEEHCTKSNKDIVGEFHGRADAEWKGPRLSHRLSMPVGWPPLGRGGGGDLVFKLQ